MQPDTTLTMVWQTYNLRLKVDIKYEQTYINQILCSSPLNWTLSVTRDIFQDKMINMTGWVLITYFMVNILILVLSFNSQTLPIINIKSA